MSTTPPPSSTTRKSTTVNFASLTSSDRLILNGLIRNVNTLSLDTTAKDAAAAAAAAQTKAVAAQTKAAAVEGRVTAVESVAAAAESAALGAARAAAAAKEKAEAGVDHGLAGQKGVQEITAYIADQKKIDDIRGIKVSINNLQSTLNDNIPGMNATIKNLQDDINAMKVSALVQTCSGLGKQDGNLRLYTEEECDAMNGNYQKSGECIKKEGGSFSYECGQLYKEGPKNMNISTNANAPKAAANAAANAAASATASTTPAPSATPNTVVAAAIAAADGAIKEGLSDNVQLSTQEAARKLMESNALKTSGAAALQASGAAAMYAAPFAGPLLENPSAAALRASGAAALQASGAAAAAGQIQSPPTAADRDAAYNIAKQLGLRAASSSITKRGWSLDISTEVSDYRARAHADITFTNAIVMGRNPTDAAAEAKAAGITNQSRIRQMNPYQDAASKVTMGSDGEQYQVSRGYSLPPGNYPESLKEAADRAFEAVFPNGFAEGSWEHSTNEEFQLAIKGKAAAERVAGIMSGGRKRRTRTKRGARTKRGTRR